MKRTTLFSLALVALVPALALAQNTKGAQAPAVPEIKLPPGWTLADMQACMQAATPGKMHEHLVQGVGEWKGKHTMWLAPGAPPLTSECTCTETPLMDGRYVKVEMKGEIPGMGPYTGLGIMGFDNVSQEFVATWLDNHSTGLMTATGKLSPNGKTLTTNYTYNCPLTKKPAVMRHIETLTGPDSKTIEMHGPDPKTGKEYKMMAIELTRKK